MGIVFLAHVHAINIGFPGAHELRCLVNARFSGCQMKATLAAAPLLASVDWEDSCHFFCSAVQGPQPCRGICFQWPAQRTHPQGGRLFLPGLPLSSPDPNEPPTQPSHPAQASCHSLFSKHLSLPFFAHCIILALASWTHWTYMLAVSDYELSTFVSRLFKYVFEAH